MVNYKEVDIYSDAEVSSDVKGKVKKDVSFFKMKCAFCTLHFLILCRDVRRERLAVLQETFYMR